MAGMHSEETAFPTLDLWVSLHVLTEIHEYSLMMCLDAEDLKSWAGWDGAAGLSRQHLLSELSSK